MTFLRSGPPRRGGSATHRIGRLSRLLGALGAPLVTFGALAVPVGTAQATSAVTPYQAIPTTGSANAVAVTPDGTTAYVVDTSSNQVSVVDLATASITTTISVGVEPQDLAIAPNGQVWVVNQGGQYSFGTAGTVTVITPPSGSGSDGSYATSTIDLRCAPRQIVMPAGTGDAYITCSGSQVLVYSLSSEKKVASITTGVPLTPTALAASPNGSTVYVGSGYGTAIGVIDTATNTLTSGILPPSGASYGFNSMRQLVVSPNGQTLYAVNPLNQGVVVIDTQSDTVTGEITGSDTQTGSTQVNLPNIKDFYYPISAAISPDGAYLYVGNENSAVDIVSTATDQITSVILASRANVHGIAMVPNDTEAVLATSQYGTGFVDVLPLAPEVTSVTPTRGPVAGGTTVTLEGRNLVTSSGSLFPIEIVDFGPNNPASALSCEATGTGTVQATCNVTSPAGQGSVGVAVSDIDGTSAILPSDSFLYSNVPTLSITTTSLSDGWVGVPYSAQLTSSGGLPPDTWSVVSGALPSGLTLNSATGTISGTPTTAGTFSFTVEETDSESPAQVAQASFTITIHTVTACSGVTLSASTTVFPFAGAVNLSAQAGGCSGEPVTYTFRVRSLTTDPQTLTIASGSSATTTWEPSSTPGANPPLIPGFFELTVSAQAPGTPSVTSAVTYVIAY